jgi:GNAT superfamily N-acetyltransferase
VSAERRVEKLRADHSIEGFDCGKEELNRYLLRYAWANQQAGAAQTYVGLVGNSVIGYHTLVVGQVSREEAPGRLIKGLARHPVPVMLLARLAVDRRWHGQGVGRALLKDAMQRTLQAADIAGIRAFAVHAKDQEARHFYEKFDFVPSATDPMHLFVLLKDVRRIVNER